MQSTQIPDFQQITTQTAESSVQNINKPTTINIESPEIDMTAEIPEWLQIAKVSTMALLAISPIISSIVKKFTHNKGIVKEVNELKSQIKKERIKGVAIEEQIVEDVGKLNEAIVKSDQYKQKLQTMTIPTQKYEQKIDEYVQQTYLDFAEKYHLTEAQQIVYQDALRARENFQERKQGLPKMLRMRQENLQWYEKRQKYLFEELEKLLEKDTVLFENLDNIVSLKNENVQNLFKDYYEFQNAYPVEILPEYRQEIQKEIQHIKEMFINTNSSIEEDIKKLYRNTQYNTDVNKLKEILEKQQVDTRYFQDIFDQLENLDLLIDQEQRLKILQKEVEINRQLYMEKNPNNFIRQSVEKQCFDYLEQLIKDDVEDEYVKEMFQKFIDEEIPEQQRQTAQKIFDDVFDMYENDLKEITKQNINSIYKQLLEEVKQYKLNLFDNLINFNNVLQAEEQINQLQKLLPENANQMLDIQKNKILSKDILNLDIQKQFKDMYRQKQENALQINKLIQQEKQKYIFENLEDPVILELLQKQTKKESTRNLIQKIIQEQSNFMNSVYNQLKESFEGNQEALKLIEESQRNNKMSKQLENIIRQEEAGKVLIDILKNPEIKANLIKGGEFLFDSRIESIKDKQIQRALDQEQFYKIQLPSLTKKYNFDFINGTKEELEQYIRILEEKKYFKQLAKQGQISIDLAQRQPQLIREIYNVVQEEIKPMFKEFSGKTQDNYRVRDELERRLKRGVVKEFDIFLDKANVENYNELLKKIKTMREPLWQQDILAFNYYTNPEFITPVEKDKLGIITKLEELTGRAIEVLVDNSNELLNDMLQGDYRGAARKLKEAEKQELQKYIQYYLNTEQMYLQESKLFDQFKDQPYRYYNLNNEVLKKHSIFQDQQVYEKVLQTQKNIEYYQNALRQLNLDEYNELKQLKQNFYRDNIQNRRQGDVYGILKTQIPEKYIPERTKQEQQMRYGNNLSYVLNKQQAQEIYNIMKADFEQQRQQIEPLQKSLQQQERILGQTTQQQEIIENVKKQENFLQQSNNQVPLETKEEQQKRLLTGEEQKLREGQFIVKMLADQELPENIPGYSYQWDDMNKSDYTLPENQKIDNKTSKELINENLEQLINQYKNNRTKGEKRYIPTTKSTEFNQLVEQFQKDRQQILDTYNNYFQQQGVKGDIVKIKDLPGVERELKARANIYIDRFNEKQNRDNNKIINRYSKNIKGKEQKIQSFNQSIQNLLDAELNDKNIQKYNDLYNDLMYEYTQYPRRRIDPETQKLIVDELTVREQIPQRHDAQYYNKNYEPDSKGKIKWDDWYFENYTEKNKGIENINTYKKLQQRENYKANWNDNRQHLTTNQLTADYKRARADNYIRDRIIETRGWYDDTKSLWQNFKQLSYEQKYNVVKNGIPQHIDRDFLNNITFRNRDKGYRDLPIEVFEEMLEQKEKSKNTKKRQKEKSNQNQIKILSRLLQ